MAAQAQQKPALDFEEARRMVITAVRSLAVQREREVVPLDEAYGRILFENAVADRDYPAVRRSLRDGFAIRCSDVPGTLRVRGEVRAGDAPQQPLQSGEALEIMTGAPVPEGADAVVMIEHVVRSGSSVQVDRPAEPRQFVNERGAECKSGSTLIRAGTRLDGSHIGSLAMTGNARVSVIQRPSVAILATGDEIVAIDAKPAGHEIRNSNSHMMAALVRATGGVPTVLPVASDAPDILRPLIEDGIKHAMLIVSGGVSAGKYDFVKAGLREFGVHFHFERVRVQPGQPTVFGTVGNKPVFGLPGNPGSTLITYQLFARPALELLAGITEPILPLLSAKFEASFRHKPGLTRFLPALLSADGEHLRHIPWQGSSDVPALAKANAFLVADHDRETWQPGDTIRVMLKQ